MLTQQQVNQNIQKGMELRAQNQKEQAVRFAQQIYTQAPQNKKAISFFALTLLEAGIPEQAIKLLNGVIEIFGEIYEFSFDLGGVYKAIGNKEKALEAYKKALELNPKCDKSAYFIGQIYLKTNLPEKAIPYLEKSLELNADNPEAAHLLNIAKGDTLETASKDYVSKVFDDFADNFEDTLVNKLDYKTPEKICSQFKKHAHKQSETIIDLGCGTGLCGPLLAPACSTLKGVDLSQKMLDKAKEKNLYQELACEDITDYLNKHQNIDAAIAADVFVYIGDLEPIFKACHKALKDNGLFSFSVEKSEQDKFEALISGRFAHNLNHLKELSKSTNFEWLEDEETIIRTEANKDVIGYLITLKKRS